MSDPAKELKSHEINDTKIYLAINTWLRISVASIWEERFGITSRPEF